MPNWCSTTYRFHGTEEELNTLNNKIREWTSRSVMKTDFGDAWLGNILIGAGLKDRIDNADSSLKIRCRGTLVDINEPSHINGNWFFDLWTETAWAPMAKMWCVVIKTLGLKTVDFSFIAEESGCDVYLIYDPNNHKDFTDNEVYIDAYGDNEAENICGYYKTQDAIDVLNNFFSTNCNELDDFSALCEEYENEHEDSFINIHVFSKITSEKDILD